MGVYLMGSDETVILPFDHPEASNLPYNRIEALTKGLEIWTPDKKRLMFVVPEQGSMNDTSVLEYVVAGEVSDGSKFYPKVIRTLQERYYNKENVNQSIPIGKWAEYIREYSWHLKSVIEEHGHADMTPGYLFLAQIAVRGLQWIESSGLHVDEALLKKHFGPKSKFMRNGLIHSEYNLFTAAGRPSCRFGGINFAALNKETGEREVFTSRFDDGTMVLLDFESYHVRLIAAEIGYTLPKMPSHEYFGQHYFGTNKLTPEQYEESKRKTFTLLYSDADSDVPFFQKVKKFKQKLWNDIQSQGYIESPMGKLLRLEHIWEPNPAKVFNYYIQWLETEQNLNLLLSIMHIFRDKQSKVVLYNYDAFLIDFSLSDGRGLITETINLLECGGKFPVRVKFGPNYGSMSPLTLHENPRITDVDSVGGAV